MAAATSTPAVAAAAVAAPVATKRGPHADPVVRGRRPRSRGRRPTRLPAASLPARRDPIRHHRGRSARGRRASARTPRCRPGPPVAPTPAGQPVRRLRAGRRLPRPPRSPPGAPGALLCTLPRVPRRRPPPPRPSPRLPPTPAHHRRRPHRPRRSAAPAATGRPRRHRPCRPGQPGLHEHPGGPRQPPHGDPCGRLRPLGPGGGARHDARGSRAQASAPTGNGAAGSPDPAIARPRSRRVRCPSPPTAGGPTGSLPGGDPASVAAVIPATAGPARR